MSEQGLITPPAPRQFKDTVPPSPEVPPVVPPTPVPQPGTLIFDARRDLPTLFNGTVKTYTIIGNISPGGLGLECRASGSPKIVSNTDGTFSLICGAGHGRFYGYVKNWDALLDIECAFWNQASGQDCSLKITSRHNESGDCNNRFGGHGFSVDRSGWGAKDESCHNNHTNSTSGSLPEKIETGKYFNIQFSVKHADKEIAKINGKQVLSRAVANYSSKALNEQNSYFWVRSNIDSGQGELRIRNLRMFAI